MRRSDFDEYGISFFTFEEVASVAGNMEEFGKVALPLIATLDRTRRAVGQPIRIIRLTHGKSRNFLHGDGLAVDFACDAGPNETYRASVDGGFSGIGVYRNRGRVFSYHGDIAPGPCRRWVASKDANDNWQYKGMIQPCLFEGGA